MLDAKELPEVILFSEARDRTVLILFPAEVLSEMRSRGVLRDFPSLHSQGTLYYVKGKVTAVQYRFPLILLSRLERVTAGYVQIRWKNKASDMDSPQETGAGKETKTDERQRKENRLDLR